MACPACTELQQGELAGVVFTPKFYKFGYTSIQAATHVRKGPIKMCLAAAVAERPGSCPVLCFAKKTQNLLMDVQDLSMLQADDGEKKMSEQMKTM